MSQSHAKRIRSDVYHATTSESVRRPMAFAEAAAGAAPHDNRPDAALVKSVTMPIGIVATVGVDDLGVAKRPGHLCSELAE